MSPNLQLLLTMANPAQQFSHAMQIYIIIIIHFRN